MHFFLLRIFISVFTDFLSQQSQQEQLFFSSFHYTVVIQFQSNQERTSDPFVALKAEAIFCFLHAAEQAGFLAKCQAPPTIQSQLHPPRFTPDAYASRHGVVRLFTQQTA